MLLNCGVGEDSWESLGLQGDPTSPSQRKSVLNTHWKDWFWSWNSNNLATWGEELTHLKKPGSWEDWSQEEKGMTEDEMVGWHHSLNGHEFEQALGDSEGQVRLACYSPRGHKESNMTEWLNWTELGCWQWVEFIGLFYVSPGKSRSPGDSPVFKLNDCFSRKPLYMSWAFTKVHILILYKLICSCQHAPLSSH